MSISLKNLLKEDPDQLTVSSPTVVSRVYDQRDGDVIGLFSVVDVYRHVAISLKRPTLDIFIDDPEIEEIYKKANGGDLKFHKQNFYHHFLHEPLKDAGLVDDDARENPEYLVSGRIWKDREFKGKTICSFWQDHKEVKKELTHVHNSFTMIGLDIKNCRFEFLGNQGELFTYDRAFGDGSDEITSNLSTDQIKALQKIQHLTPQAKKALLSDYPPNRLQRAANSLGISYVQLRHILTGPELVGKKSFEENLDIDSFLDGKHLNFSDFFDPNVPYEQKPPQSLKPME